MDLRYVHEVEFLLGSAYRGYHIYHGKKRQTGYVFTRVTKDTNEKSIQMSEKYVIELGALLLPSIGGQPQGNATPGKQHVTERIPKKNKGNQELSLRLLDCVIDPLAKLAVKQLADVLDRRELQEVVPVAMVVRGRTPPGPGP